MKVASTYVRVECIGTCLSTTAAVG